MIYHEMVSYLWVKGQTYYFDRRVPKDIQAHYKASRIVICLKTSSAPNGVIKQELITLEQTPDGIRITRLKRLFSEEAVNSSFESESIRLT